MSPVVASIQSRIAAAGRAARQRVYHDPRWRGPTGTRLRVLNRDDWTCTLCGAHATIADHHPTPLRTLITQGHDPYDPTTCRSLCLTCSGAHDGGRS